MGLAVYCMMQSLGEMATQLPIPGSFEAYAERFVDPSLAFAVGWNYWFSWAITLAAELVAGALIVQFWFPHSNSAYWAMGFFAVLLALNLLSVRAYAEAEYWFAGIKVVTVIIFVAVGFLMIAGMLGNQSSGFHNWTLSDPKAGTHAPFVGGFTSMLTVFLVAGFSFQGTEGVGLAAAETAGSRQERAEGNSNRVLAHFVVLHRRHFRCGHVDSVHGSEFAQCRRKPHRLFTFHHGPAAVADGWLLRVESHECGHSLLGVVVRKFIHVRGIAHAACHGPQPQSAESIRHAE